MRFRHPQTADRVAFEIELDDPTGSLPTTQPRGPVDPTICGALCSTTQPSAYSMWISPRARKPTCACMQARCDDRFMSTASGIHRVDHPLYTAPPGPSLRLDVTEVPGGLRP